MGKFSTCKLQNIKQQCKTSMENLLLEESNEVKDMQLHNKENREVT